MPTRRTLFNTPEAIKSIADNISHKFHLLEESLERINEKQTPAKDLIDDIEEIKKDFSALEEASKNDPQLSRNLIQLNEKIKKVEDAVTVLSTGSSITLEAAQKLINDIKGATADIPVIAEMMDIPVKSIAQAPDKLPPLVELKEKPISAISSTNKDAVFISSTISNRPFDVSVQDGFFEVKEKPFVNKVRINAYIEDSGEAGSYLPLMIMGIKKSGEKAFISSGTTNSSGYLSVDTTKMDLSPYEKIEITTHSNLAASVVINIRDFVMDIIRNPIRFNIPDNIARQIREKPRDFIAIDTPDADDLVNDPEAFSFDINRGDDSACIKARPEIAVRNFSFSQLVRAEESDLIEQNADDATIRLREAVTAPVPVRPNNNMGANLSVVGGRIITGKIINYRQSWQPAAQGLGKLLYSLALAPREEIKIAVIDWRRTENARRQDGVRMGESLTAQMNRDTTISDIVTGEIEEEVMGGSESSSTTEANNKPGWGAYLGGAIIGGIIGGPVGAGLGIAAVHYVRPDTGADSDAYIDSWNNAVRNISAQSVHKASDVVSQRASTVRDFHSTIVTASEVTEQENVRTRTVRNQNQHHALTIQYYQVLAHYRVITEAISEEDVLLVPYAIDHDIFASLPRYQKFIANPKMHTITKFCLRYSDAIRHVLPRHLRRGMDALVRLAYDTDSYEDPQVTASRWTLLSGKELNAGIDIFLDTQYGLVPLRSTDQSRTQFTSSQVALDHIRGIQFRLDIQRYAENALRISGSRFLPDEFINQLIDRLLDNLEIVYSDIQLNAHITRTRYVRSNISVYTLDSHGEVSLDLNNSSGTLRLNTPLAAELNGLLNTNATPRGEDYQAVEAMVNWMQQNPMTTMASIWMREDSNERALRFDRLSYNNRSLLNIIENQPLGVDGNYVAFRLAPNLRVLPPIDLSSIRRQSTVVSVPTSGVFAETYLSCNNATEKRDITREIDNSKAVPFGAPDIAPINTGIRSGSDMPQVASMPSSVVNFQNVPGAPSTAIGDALQGLTASSPFPNLSYGAETMETIRTLADTAMKVDGDKQKEILNTITELSKLAADAAMAAMGVPPVGSALSSGGGGSASQAGGAGGGSGASGGSTSGSNAQHRAQVGQSVRESDPATNYDHIRVVEEAEKRGQLTSDKAATVVENILGATPSEDADVEVNDPAQEEWEAHPGIHHHFNFANGPANLELYRQLRPRYQEQGIANPAEYLDNNIVMVEFFTHRTPAHRDLVEPLNAAQAELEQQNIVPDIQSFWGFVPRLTASGNLSNHALGRAIDINPAGNPHIFNHHEVRVIDAVTGVDFGSQQDFETLRQADQAFRNQFNQEWVDQQNEQLQQLLEQAEPSESEQQQIQGLQQLIQSIDARRNRLDSFAANGFLNLEQPLIDALVNAGFTWGGYWRTQKDFMHIELP